MNVGYNGSKGNHLDITSAPRATAEQPQHESANLVFNYDQARGVLEVQRRHAAGEQAALQGLCPGRELSVLALHRRCRLGGQQFASVGAQNWQNLDAEEGNSSLDQRHKVSGTYLYELPSARISTGSPPERPRTFSKASPSPAASPLPPDAAHARTMRPQVSSVACGTAGTLRPDRYRVSVTAGGGSLKQWFNPAAYSAACRAMPLIRASLRQCVAQLDSRAGNGPEQHVAFEDHAAGRYAQHGNSRHHQQCVQHRAVLGRGHQRGFADLWAGDFGGTMRSFQFMAQVQILESS